jgi:hypothetical protein
MHNTGIGVTARKLHGAGPKQPGGTACTGTGGRLGPLAQAFEFLTAPPERSAREVPPDAGDTSGARPNCGGGLAPFRA